MDRRAAVANPQAAAMVGLAKSTILNMWIKKCDEPTKESVGGNPRSDEGVQKIHADIVKADEPTTLLAI